MALLVFCLVGIAALIAITGVVLGASTLAGVIVGVIALALTVPLLAVLVAQIDLLRQQVRYGFSHDEAEFFARLLPQTTLPFEAAGKSRNERKRLLKAETARLVLAQRAASGTDLSSAGAVESTSDRSGHPDTGAFSCPVCGETMATQIGLDHHMAAKHAL